MTENLKSLLEKVSADEALRAKFESVAKIEDKITAAEAILALAAEAGMPLTEADLEPEEELDLDELDAVAGGGTCACALFGGGKAGDFDRMCYCAAGGWGDGYKDPLYKTTDTRCVCPVAGGGTSLD